MVEMLNALKYLIFYEEKNNDDDDNDVDDRTLHS